jgi:sulfur-oxidizing protein SoxY
MSARHSPRSLSRRAVTAGLLSLVSIPFAAAATPPDVEAAIKAALGDGPFREGGVIIRIPDLAENGAQVPVTVDVETEPRVDRHVRGVHLFATRNPTPGIASFTLGPASARPLVATRIRVAEGQQVLAFVVWSDGVVERTAAEVRVSVGGCAT